MLSPGRGRVDGFFAHAIDGLRLEGHAFVGDVHGLRIDASQTCRRTTFNDRFGYLVCRFGRRHILPRRTTRRSFPMVCRHLSDTRLSPLEREACAQRDVFYVGCLLSMVAMARCKQLPAAHVIILSEVSDASCCPSRPLQTERFLHLEFSHDL